MSWTLAGRAAARLPKRWSAIIGVGAAIAWLAAPAAAQAQATVSWAAPAGTLGWCNYLPNNVNHCFGSPGEACYDLYRWWAPTGSYVGYADKGIWSSKACKWNGIPYPADVYFLCSSGSSVAPGRCTAETLPARAPGDGGVGQCRPCTEHPIDIVTGAKLFRAEDYSNGAALDLSRTFSSMPTGNMHGLVVRPLAGLANWAFDFEYELQIATWDQNNQTLAVLSPHGSSYLFKRDASGNMVPNNDGVDVVPQHDYKLSYDGAWPSDVTGIQSAQTNWILQDSQDRVWYLQSRKDPATNRWLIAQPVRMVEPGGRELKFLYGFQNELDSITDSNGNQITFEWQWTTLPAAISVAHLPGGDSIHYVYESIGSDNSNPDRLIRVEFKDASGAIVDRQVTPTETRDFRFLSPKYVTAMMWCAGR
jgi:hypothetical protein